MPSVTAAAALLSALDKLLTPTAAADFDRKGFVVFCPSDSQSTSWPDGARTFLDEIKMCHRGLGATSPNKVEFLTTDGPVQLVKPNIFEFDLHDRTSSVRRQLESFDDLVSAQLAGIAELFAQRCQTLHTLAVAPPEDPSKESSGGMERHVTVKIQVNEGGCFPWHYDNPGPPNKRLLTLAVYLTPGWTTGDGGELVLKPFLGAEVVVPPSLGTIAIFRSDTICHRVRPLSPSGPSSEVIRSRYCFTVWFDGTSTNGDEDVNIRVKHLQQSFIGELCVSPLQRTLSRAVYNEEYELALAECFGSASREFRLSLAMHVAHCKALCKSEKAREFVEELRRQVPQH
jgi:hypothetical protein